MPWRRRPFREKSVSRALNIGHLREIASRSLPHFIFEYVEGGAEDEASLRHNRAAFESYRLIPSTLVDVSGPRPKLLRRGALDVSEWLGEFDDLARERG